MTGIAPVNIVHALNRALRLEQTRLKPFPMRSTRVIGGRPTAPVISHKMKIDYKSPTDKTKRAKRELLDAGVTFYGLLKAESRYLPKILHDNEQIETVIYGQHNSNSAMMVATDERIIYLDKKPMVEMFDEISYEVVSGIEFDIHFLFATVVLHTPVKNYQFRYVNLRCAEKFARHIEKHRLEREPKALESAAEILPPNPGLSRVDTNQGLNDMAGYYWLPTDEEERRKAQQAIT